MSSSGPITVVGLGPGDPALRTYAAQLALNRARQVILRTAVHPGLDDLLADPRVSACDDLYDAAPAFDDLYRRIADRVLAAAADGDVVYAVPGHPRFGERSVARLVVQAEAALVPIAVQDAVGAIDAIATALGVDLLAEQVQLLDAIALADALDQDPFSGGRVSVDPSRPCLVTQVYSAPMATATKLALGRLYPDNHPVAMIRAAAVPGVERVTRCALYELDRHPIDHLTSVWVNAAAPLAAHRATATLQRIVAHLRAPGGCPWDREQTHASLRGALLEEAYEAVDAIDDGDPDNLAEELGDLLMQVALHAQIAEEHGTFTFEDVVEHVNRKLVRRHPHVFATAVAGTPDEVVRTWNEVKADERRGTYGGINVPSSPLDRLPRSMPALSRAAHMFADSQVAGRPRIAMAGSPNLGDRLLALAAEAAAAGLDPELELERALRRALDQADTAAAVSASGTDRDGGQP